MALTQKHFNQIIQSFMDGSYEDETLQVMLNEYQEIERTTGIRDSSILEKIFVYLDMKLQDEIRYNIKH